METNKTDKTALQPKEQSTALIAILTDPEQSRQLEKGLTIKKIIDNAIPISEVVRVAGSKAVAIAIDIQLTRLVANLNLKWSLNDSQIKTIVDDLVEKYPNESIEDFVLVFKKARLGEFGELIRLDSPIVFSWVEKYLDEKYTEVEKKLMAEKDEYHKNIIPENTERDWLSEWKQALDTNGMKPVRPISEKEIAEEGQEKPKKPVFIYNASEAEIRLKEHHEQLWKFQELTFRERHPEYSEEDIIAKLAELKKTVLENESSVRFMNPELERIWNKRKRL